MIEPENNEGKRVEKDTQAIRCPKCEGTHLATLEMIYGTCDITIDSDGTFEYNGETNIDWNSQESVRDDGKFVLICRDCDHKWTEGRLKEEEE